MCIHFQKMLTPTESQYVLPIHPCVHSSIHSPPYTHTHTYIYTLPHDKCDCSSLATGKMFLPSKLLLTFRFWSDFAFKPLSPTTPTCPTLAGVPALALVVVRCSNPTWPPQTSPPLPPSPIPSLTFPASAWSWPVFCSAPRSSCSPRGAGGGSRWWRGGAGPGCHTVADAGSGRAGRCGGAGLPPAGHSSGRRRMPGRALAPPQAYRS